MSRWTNRFDREKLFFIAGLVLSAFALFTSYAVVSYLFTWKADQDFIGAARYFDESMRVANGAGRLGLGWGNFLVSDCFGLASLLLCALLCWTGAKMVLSRRINWVKLSIVALPFTLLLGLLFAWLSMIIGHGTDTVFGGGIGGNADNFIVKALNDLFGPVITIVFLLVLFVIVCTLLSDKFFNAVHPSGNIEEDSDDSAKETAPVEISLTEDDVYGLPADTDDSCEDDSSEESFEEPVPVYDGGEEDVEDEEFDDDEPEMKVTINGPEEELSTDIKEELPPLDIKGEVGRYKMPPLDLLEDYADKRFTIPRDEIDRNTEKIKATLASFKMTVESISASVGYTVTLYKITLGEGVRVAQVKNREEDIAIKLGNRGVRVVILNDAVGIEVPNERSSVVPLKAILNSDAFRNSKAELPIALGYTITTKAKVFDLADAPHLLVAGATKQGKSVCLNAIISSLLYSKHPTEMKFVFVDPKMVEFQQYGKLINHYLAFLPAGADNPNRPEEDCSIIKDSKLAEETLRSLCVEMDQRYKLMASACVNKVTDYNEKYKNRFLKPTDGHYYMPYLVIVVDEYADLTKAGFGSDKNIARSIENSINRLAAKGRAAGLHIVIATQRPSVDVITGTIKGNFPTRIAFRTVAPQDSMTILGQKGAEKLIGRGDMLYFTGADAERVQCALIDSRETDKLTSFVAEQTGFRQRCSQPYYLPEPGNLDGSPVGGEPGMIDMKNIDPLFPDAANLAVLSGSLSTTQLQRKMSLGFARAGKIMDQLEAAGVVGPSNGSKPREVLVPDLATLQGILDAYMK